MAIDTADVNALRGTQRPAGDPRARPVEGGRGVRDARTHRKGTQGTWRGPFADMLGWASVGLALTAILAPRAVRRITGLSQRDSLLVMAAATAAVTATHVIASSGNARRSAARSPARSDAYLDAAIITSKAPQECYAFWRELSNLPKFIHGVNSVIAGSDGEMRWSAGADRAWEWETRMTVDRPGECIGWKSLEGAPVQQSGLVSFDPAPGGRGTLVRFSMHYLPSGHTATKLPFAKLFGTDAHSRAVEDLRRFRQLIETGEIPSTRGQPSGRRSVMGRWTREGRLSREGNTL